MAKRNVDLILRARDQASRNVRRVTGAVTGLTRVLKGAVVAGAAFFGLRALNRFRKDVIGLASDTEETGSKFSAVFKELTEEADAWALSFAKSVGRSNLQIRMFLSNMQDTFVPLGFARKEAKKMSEQIVELTVDIASFNNKADPDVLRDLQSAIVGNHETVRKYGIIITQAALSQELLNMGIRGGAKRAEEQEKAQARLNLIMKGTSDAQGDAVRTASSYANQVKRLQANIENLKVTIGNRLLPTANRFTTWLNENFEVVERWEIKISEAVINAKDSFFKFMNFLRTDFTRVTSAIWQNFLTLFKAAIDSAVVLAVAAGKGIAAGVKAGILGGEPVTPGQVGRFEAEGGRTFSQSEVNRMAHRMRGVTPKELTEREFARIGHGFKTARLIRREELPQFREFRQFETGPSAFSQVADIFRTAATRVQVRSSAAQLPPRASLRAQARALPAEQRTITALEAILAELKRQNSPMPGQGRDRVIISTGT